MKSCAARNEYFGGTSVKKGKRISAVKRGTVLVSNAVMSSKHSNTDSLVELMAHMHDDEIKHVAMSDRLICREADLRMDGLGNKEDRKQDDVYRVSQAA